MRPQGHPGIIGQAPKGIAMANEVNHSQRNSRRWLKRLTLIGCLLLLLAIALGCFARWYYAFTGERELRGYMAELDATDPGWRLEDIEAARSVIPEEDNSALVVVAAKSALREQWGEMGTQRADSPSWLEERVKALGLNEKLDDELAGQLDYELSQAAGPVTIARSLAHRPRGRHAVAYAPDFISTNLSDQQGSRDVARLLCLDAASRAQKGEIDAALDSCRAGVNTGRSIGDESVLPVLARIGSVSRAADAVERVLAQGIASDEALARLQALLEDEASQNLSLTGIRGDRAGFHRLMEELEVGRVSLEHAIGSSPPKEFVAIVSLLGPGFYKRNHQTVLSWFTDILEVLGDGADDHETALEALRIRLVRDRSKHDKLLAALILPAVQKVAAAEQRHRAHLRSAIAALAAERFRMRHHEWPTSLQALVADGLLTKTPRDPFDRNPLRICRTEDGLIIYSVGPDRVDDGGKISRERPTPDGSDVGFRLWNADQRHSSEHLSH